MDSETIKICTALKPSFTDVNSVNALIDGCNIPDDIILYHIREASKYALFLNEKLDQNDTSFEVEQFVKYRAAKDCILRFYIDMASNAGVSGKLGDAEFDYNAKSFDISDLLRKLEAETKVWQDAVRGFKNEGRVKPASALKGRTQIPLPDMSHITPISSGYDRGI